jgi:hypothetical protein
MFVVVWFLLAVAVGVLASNRGRSGFGWFLLSAVLSPLLGFVFVLVAKNLAVPVGVPQESGATHVRCSECAEWVLPEATTCKHCGAKLVPDLDFHRRQAVVRELILALCSLRPCTATDLARVLGDRDPGELKRLHLKPLREAGQLALKYPETEKHPHQAYLTVQD